MNKGFRIFGAPFDPVNSPERLDLKLAYLSHLQRSAMLPTQFYDPYDVIQADLKPRFSDEDAWIGKMPVDSWLTPRPQVSDLPLMNARQFASFLGKNGCWDYSLRVAEFVERQIFPYIPVMIGVDHSSTGGLLLALARKYDNLNIVILDAHFDVMRFSKSAFDKAKNQPPFYHCGNFLSKILRNGIVRPENLWILGVGENVFSEDYYQRMDNQSRNNAKEAEKWINQGVHVLFKEDIISKEMNLHLTGPAYVSIDMDIGSLSSIFSARFMTCEGLSAKEFLHLLSNVALSVKKAGVPLIGIDIMEIDIHLLEIAKMTTFDDHTKIIVGEIFDLFLK